MASAKFFDRYVSTLASGYTSGGTSLTVSSAGSGASALPASGDFWVAVETEGANTEEVFKVTAVSGTTLTVTGAQAGTVASDHAAGAVIRGALLTAGALAQLKTDAAVTVQDEGVAVTLRPVLNFVGAGVTVTDDPANNRTIITIAGGAVDTGLYRYWRILITSTLHGSDTAFAEIELRDTAGGPDLTGSGTASASASYPGYPPAQAVDNNTTTAWNTQGAGPWTWSYDFGAGATKNIIEIRITPWDAALNKGPRDFQWQYSADGATWGTRATKTSVTWPTTAAQTFNVSGV